MIMSSPSLSASSNLKEDISEALRPQVSLTQLHGEENPPSKKIKENELNNPDLVDWDEIDKETLSQTQLNDEEKPSPKKEKEDKVKDPNLVDWDENDKENPRNWSTGYKSWITLQLSLLALAASLGSSIIAPAEQAFAEYVGIRTEVAVLSISLYM